MEGTPPQGPPGGPGDEPELSPEQQEMLRQMEEEMRRVRVQDVVTQSTVSILNLAARRIAKEDERDLEQGRIGIEAVRALVGLLDDAEAEREVRNALSQLQLMYAEQTEAAAGGGSEEGSGGAPQAPESGSESAGGPPPAPKQSALWTPGRD